LIYLDTPAFVKLILPEAETNSSRHRLQGARPVSSALLGVETLRAVARRAPQLLPAARSLLNGVDQVAITPAILAEAQTLPRWSYGRSTPSIWPPPACWPGISTR